MPHVDNAVFTPAAGFIYVAPVGADRPASTAIASGTFITDTPDAAFTGYTSIGHTSLDDLPEFGFDGGKTEVQGTWSNRSFREVVTEAPVDYVTFQALQFDEQVLGLYYGLEDATASDGVFEVNEAPLGTVERALLIVIVDGTRRVAFHAPRVSLRRDDSTSFESDEFAAFPIRATFLKYTDPVDGAQPLYSWFGVTSVPAPTTP